MAQAEVEAEPKAVERNWQSIIDRRRAYEQKKKKYADAVENADNAINNKAAAYEALRADPVFQQENGIHGRGHQEDGAWCCKRRPETRHWNPKKARAEVNEMNFHINFDTPAHPPQGLQVLDSQPVTDSSGSSEHDLSRAPAATGSQPAEAHPESSSVWKGLACAPPQAADEAADKRRQPQSKATDADKPATDAKKAAAADAKTHSCYKQAGYVPATPAPPARISCSDHGPPPLGPWGGPRGGGPMALGPPP